jgi:hypothetical protein
MLNLYDQSGNPSLSDSALTLLQRLMQVRPEVCRSLPAELLKRRIWGSGILYYGADAATRATLISEAEAALTQLIAQFPDLVAHPLQWNDPSLPSSVRKRLGQLISTKEWQFLDRALRLLSWIGDESVQQWFHQRRTQMTTWESLFYLSIEDYVTEAGWELTAEGHRRDLYFQSAYQLVPVEEASDDTRSAVGVIVPFEESCQWCGCPLTVLFDLDVSHPALSFLSLDGHRLRIIMCEGCFIGNTLFMEVDFEGNAHWSSFNTLQMPSADWYPTRMLFTPPDHQLVLGPPCASPFEVVNSGDDWDISQIGGAPSWVQDANYVRCPSCRHRMIFVGQITPSAVTDRAVDGVLYGLMCFTCRLSAVIYQCT